MRKIFLFLFAAVLSIGTASAYDVEINDANWIVGGYELSLETEDLYLHTFNFDDNAIDKGVNQGVSEDDGGQTTIRLQLTSSELDAYEEWVDARVISYSPLAASATLAISGTTESGKTFYISGDIEEVEYRESLDAEMKDLQVTHGDDYTQLVASGFVGAGTLNLTLHVSEDGTVLSTSSATMGGDDIVIIEGNVSLDADYSKYYGTDTYVGVVTVDYSGMLCDINVVMYYFTIDYTMIDIFGATATLQDVYDGWGTSYSTVLNITSTYTDEYGVTYPVKVEVVDGYVPTATSGTATLSITIGELSFDDDDAPWFGSIDWADLDYSVSGGWITLQGKAGSEWTGVYWDLYITAKLLVNLNEEYNENVITTTGKVDVQVNRNFTANSLYTITLPFTLNNVASVFGAGTVAYEYAELAEDANGVVLNFKTVTKLEAGKPYLLKPANTVNGFTVNGATLSSATTTLSKTAGTTTVSMIPVPSALASNDGQYWLAENTWLYNDETAVPGLRALFNISTKSGIAPRARVALGENETTGVDNITTGAKAVKAIENGQLIITIDGVKYNVQGIKL